MKKLRKLSALLIAAVMVFAMAMPAMAAPAKPVSTDTATATVNNLSTQPGETITSVIAYKFAEAKYSDLGFLGYKLVDGLTTSDVADDKNFKPTSTEALALLEKKSSLDAFTMTVDESLTTEATEKKTGQATASLNAGYYLVEVTSSNGKTTYAPMVIGVGYNKDLSGDSNELENGSVSATDNWKFETVDAWAKSDSVDIDKKITGQDKLDNDQTMTRPSDGNDKGDDVGLDGDVEFEISAGIPQYGKEYISEDNNKVKWFITDTLSAGLTNNEDAKVYVGSKADENLVPAANLEVKYEGQVMTINLKGDDYIVGKAGQKVIVVYTAKLNSEAGVNFDANTNTVKLTYSNKPNSDSTADTDEKKTYTYTFDIDGYIWGSESNITRDIYKSGEAYESSSTINYEGLPGAKFKLYTDEACTTDIRTITTGKDGEMNFQKLDAGTYYIKETKAPNGWTLNDEVTKVVISANYNEDGTLKDYSIKFAKQTATTSEGTTTYTYSELKGKKYELNQKTKNTVINDHTALVDEEGNKLQAPSRDDDINHPYEIKDTKIPSLPSTGGMGTYIFTILGVALIGVAASLLIFKRRKDA